MRVRPLNEQEQREAGGAQHCVSVLGHRTVVLSDPNRPEPFSGTFDHVLGSSAGQEDVYRGARARIHSSWGLGLAGLALQIACDACQGCAGRGGGWGAAAYEG